MHGRIAIYSVTGDAHAISQQAEEGLLPIFQSQAGFKEYTILTTGDRVISFSAWETPEAAEAANTAAAEWVAEQMSTDEIELKKAHVGEIIVSTSLGISTKAGITA